MSKFLRSDIGNNRKAIRLTIPSLARPRRADYLLMTKSAAASLSNTEDEYGLRIDDESNLIDFQRALEIIGKEHTSKKQRLSPRPGEAKPTWQSTAISSLDKSDRWVFGGKMQKLWPYDYGATSSQRRLTVVYADVFTDLGFEEEVDAKNEERINDRIRWKNNVAACKQGSLFAVIPLLQVMGAVVSSHLHSGVTHILCEMKSRKILKWTSTLPRSVFANSAAGALMHERLLSLEESAVLNGKKWEHVMLVSPEWVMETWDENSSHD